MTAAPRRSHVSTTPTHEQADGGRTISAATLRGWTNPLVVDVRSAAEFEARHIHGSYHVPLATLAEHTAELAHHLGDPVAPLVLVCQSGVRAEQARRHLAAAGLDGAQVLDGGVPAYAAAGGRVVTGRTGWAMERQVRLAAGSLVLAGVLGGRYLHPRLRWLAGGVGSGLTFSALTDTCAMASLLAKLPFNRDVVEPAPERTLESIRRRRPGPVT